MLLGQLQRGRPTHRRAGKRNAFESPGDVRQEQSSFGSQWRRLHPLSPSLPCCIWIFPPCSSNSGPRINRVLRDTFLKHCYHGLRYSSRVLPPLQEKGPPLQTRIKPETETSAFVLQRPTFSFLSERYFTGTATSKSIRPLQNAS